MLVLCVKGFVHSTLNLPFIICRTLIYDCEQFKGIDSMVDAIKDLNFKLKSLNDRTVKRCPAV